MVAAACPYRNGSIAVAHLVPLEAERLSAGESGRAQLVFDAPTCATPGDRFIIRDARAAHTIGGGSVLDPFAPARKRRCVERLKYLDALARMIAGDGIAPLIAQARHGVRLSDLATLTGNPVERLSLPADAVVIDGDREGFAIQRAHLQDLRDRTLAALRNFHTQYPDEAGADLGRLRRIVAPDLASSRLARADRRVDARTSSDAQRPMAASAAACRHAFRQ